MTTQPPADGQPAPEDTTAAGRQGPAEPAPAVLDPEVFAVLHKARRVWAVGAIHGQRAQLAHVHRALLHRLKPGDRLVYLGNYLGRGPDITGTLDELLAFRRFFLTLPGVEPTDIAFLRGAQEEMWSKLLRLQTSAEPLSVLDWMLGHGIGETVEAYGGKPDHGRSACREGTLAITRWAGSLRRAMREHDGHFELMMHLRRAAVTDDQQLLFVHAAIDPTRPLAMQGDIFWWDTGTFDRIDAPYGSFRRVIRGYDHAHRGLSLDRPHVATIDNGCGVGGTLAAVCFRPDGKPVEMIEAED